MKKLLLWACFGLLLHPAQAQTSGATLARERVKEGVTLHDAGKYNEAVAKYNEALAADPGNVHAQSELALTCQSMGRHQEAIDLCKQLLKKGYNDASVYITYGNSLDELHRAKEAEQVYQRGLKEHPNSHLLYFNLGVAQAQHQQAPAALVSFEQAVSCQPVHASSHLYLGLMQLNQQARIPALLAMGRFLVLEPRSTRATQRLALFDQAMTKGVTRTGEKEVNIAMTVEDVQAISKAGGRSDNFALTEMVLNLAIAHGMAKDSGTVVGRFAERFTTLCESLAEAGPDKHPGFIWQYYVPYFVEMHKQGYVPAFAYLSHASQADTDPDVKQWLASHATEVQVFEEWSRNYTWPGVKF
jgi:tetratricopeptide (TPR) repeat protein